MSPIRALAVALTTTLTIGAPLAAHATELIVNGSFEAQVIDDGRWTVLPDLTGWQADASSGVELRHAVEGMAHSGANFVELDTHPGRFGDRSFDESTNSAIWQTVSTQSGAHYDLSWFYSSRGGVAANSNDILVYWNDTLLTTSGGSGVGRSGNAWGEFRFTVIGTGSDTLRFAAGGRADRLGGSLDSVSLTSAVPEADQWAMLLAGLATLGAVARRRRG